MPFGASQVRGENTFTLGISVCAIFAASSEVITSSFFTKVVLPCLTDSAATRPVILVAKTSRRGSRKISTPWLVPQSSVRIIMS